ncbi:MAG: Asp-tRNA(Asn)/Glu-tRNA(Gln) amidotransferase subunit GatA, partial [Deltaproteobacteria bacterium]|nr:Asp-tRNA(Asn)/Glu-tRNA(Gln) amidotransferase subunit GatA [Deltaproteobacteria bacterium]
EVEASVRAAVQVLEGLGAEIREVSLPHTEYAVAVYYLIATAEASSNLARFDGVKYGLRVEAGDLLGTYKATRAKGFGAEVKRRIMLGTYALSAGYYDAYYRRAQRVRTLIARDFREAFAEVDVLCCPTAPTPAFRLGEKCDDPLSMYLSDIFTIPCNLAGLPGLSLPCGFTASGLPIGLQMLSAPFTEETLLRAAHAYEQATGWHKRAPAL